MAILKLLLDVSYRLPFGGPLLFHLKSWTSLLTHSVIKSHVMVNDNIYVDASAESLPGQNQLEIDGA